MDVAVQPYALLVKRQPEMLLRESVMLCSRLLAGRAAEKLLADIASYDPQVVEGGFLLFRAAELGYDLRLRRVAVAFEVTVPEAGVRRASGPPVHVITDLRVHQVLAEVGRPARNRLLDRTAASLRAQPDWPVLRDTITAWCESGFNLVRASTALRIHRNTVVYRMHKVEQITGRPLRDHRTTMALYLACLADELGAGNAPY